jgi:hypothetical protein
MIVLPIITGQEEGEDSKKEQNHQKECKKDGFNRQKNQVKEEKENFSWSWRRKSAILS